MNFLIKVYEFSIVIETIGLQEKVYVTYKHEIYQKY